VGIVLSTMSEGHVIPQRCQKAASTGQGLTRTTNKLLTLLSPFTWETFHVEQKALNSN